MKSWKPGHAVFDYDLPQLRMQAIEAAIKQSNRTGFLAGENYILNLADLYVHYCLTGEHQLPEKK